MDILKLIIFVICFVLGVFIWAWLSRIHMASLAKRYGFEPCLWQDENGRNLYQPRMSTGERYWIDYRTWAASMPTPDSLPYLLKSQYAARRLGKMASEAEIFKTREREIARRATRRT